MNKRSLSSEQDSFERSPFSFGDIDDDFPLVHHHSLKEDDFKLL
jgi:hypothetical protein